MLRSEVEAIWKDSKARGRSLVSVAEAERRGAQKEVRMGTKSGAMTSTENFGKDSANS